MKTQFIKGDILKAIPTNKLKGHNKSRVVEQIKRSVQDQWMTFESEKEMKDFVNAFLNNIDSNMPKLTKKDLEIEELLFGKQGSKARKLSNKLSKY